MRWFIGQRSLALKKADVKNWFCHSTPPQVLANSVFGKADAKSEAEDFRPPSDKIDKTKEFVAYSWGHFDPAHWTGIYFEGGRSDTNMSMTLFQTVQNLGNLFSKSVWLSWRSSFAWASNGSVGLSLLQLMMSPNCGPMLSRCLKQARALLRMKGLRRGGCGGRCFSPSFGFWLQIIPGFCYQMQMVIPWVASTWPGLFGDALTHVTQEPTLPRCP